MTPELGRLIRPDAPPGTVVLSHAAWAEAFGAEPGAVGRSVRLDGQPHTVVGVLPPPFHLELPRRGPPAPPIDVQKNPDDRWQNGDVWKAQGASLGLLRLALPALRALRTDPSGVPRPLGTIPYYLASERYFGAARIPLVEGRLFRDGDPHEVVVSRAVAERAFPGTSALGRTVRANPWGGGPQDFDVIGVVGDVRTGSLRAPPSGGVYFDVPGWS